MIPHNSVLKSPTRLMGFSYASGNSCLPVVVGVSKLLVLLRSTRSNGHSRSVHLDKGLWVRVLNSYRKSSGTGVFGAASCHVLNHCFSILCFFFFHLKIGGAVTPPFETWMIRMACLKTPTSSPPRRSC